ncbi:MAG: hypothetical protein QNJ09_14325 [Paracoccaceae bacterium]|nr:hypothetical protein [Paracoccaceae bacterium]
MDIFLTILTFLVALFFLFASFTQYREDWEPRFNARTESTIEEGLKGAGLGISSGAAAGLFFAGPPGVALGGVVGGVAGSILGGIYGFVKLRRKKAPPDKPK